MHSRSSSCSYWNSERGCSVNRCTFATATNMDATIVCSGTPIKSSFIFHHLPPGIVTPIRVSVYLSPTTCRPMMDTTCRPIQMDTTCRPILSSHPDGELADYLVSNMDLIWCLLVQSHPHRQGNYAPLSRTQAVAQAIRSELLLGHLSGPFSQPPFHPCHCSPLGAVPKSGLFCLIVDLSQPMGTSVNNGILEEFCTVR